MKTKEQLKKEKEALLGKVADMLLPQLTERITADLKEAGTVEEDEVEDKAAAAAEKVLKGIDLGELITIDDGGAEIDKAGLGEAITEGVQKAFYDKSLFPGRRKAGEFEPGKTPAVLSHGRDRVDAGGLSKSSLSLARWIRYEMTGNDKHLADPERELLDTRESKYIHIPRPTGVKSGGPAATKALATTPDASGGFLAESEDARTIVELVDNAQQVISWIQASGGPIIDLGRDVSELPIPKEAGGHTVEWGGENTEATGSDMSFGSDSLTPKKARVLAKLSEEIVFRATPSVEQAVRQRIANDFALDLDLKYLRGDGTGGTPTGIENVTGVSTFASAGDSGDGATPTYDDHVDANNTVRQNNGRVIAMLAASRSIGSMQKLKDSQNRPIFLDPSGGDAGVGRVLGAQVMETNQIPTGLTKGINNDTSIIYLGDGMFVWIARFGGLEMAVDQSGLAFRSDQVHIKGRVFTDIVVSRPALIVIWDGIRA